MMQMLCLDAFIYDATVLEYLVGQENDATVMIRCIYHDATVLEFLVGQNDDTTVMFRFIYL